MLSFMYYLLSYVVFNSTGKIIQENLQSSTLRFYTIVDAGEPY